MSQRAPMHFWAGQSHPMETQSSPRLKNTPFQSKPGAYGRCRGLGRGHTDAATQTHRSGTGKAMGSGGAAAKTAGTASTIAVATAASMNGATAANRERKQVVSIRVRAHGSLSRDVRM